MSHNVDIIAEDVTRSCIWLCKEVGIFELYTCSCFGDLIVPVGLSDEDKLICTLINLFRSDRVLTTKRLTGYFGWSKYKCYKLARGNRYCCTTPLVCAEGGYGGTGWVLSADMHRAMFEYIRQAYPCKECKH